MGKKLKQPTLHFMMQTNAEYAVMEDMLREVVTAYVNRFAVDGRGLCGPIDEEVQRARNYLKRVEENRRESLDHR